MGTGTMPVREAVQRLVAKGALEVFPNRTVQVPNYSLADFEELSTWLASGECGTSRNELEIENAEELVRELKVEIRRKLEEHDERNS